MEEGWQGIPPPPYTEADFVAAAHFIKFVGVPPAATGEQAVQIVAHVYDGLVRDGEIQTFDSELERMAEH